MAPLRTDLFINGQYVESTGKERLSIHSPVDDSLVTDNVQVASEKDVDAAVAAAKKAFPAWRDMAGAKRAACMNKFADLLIENVEMLAELESKAMGQPLVLARRMILGPAALWKYYAGHAGKVAGESFPPDEDGTYKIVQYEPLGEYLCLATFPDAGSSTDMLQASVLAFVPGTALTFSQLGRWLRPWRLVTRSCSSPVRRARCRCWHTVIF